MVSVHVMCPDHSGRHHPPELCGFEEAAAGNIRCDVSSCLLASAWRRSLARAQIKEGPIYRGEEEGGAAMPCHAMHAHIPIHTYHTYLTERNGTGIHGEQ